MNITITVRSASLKSSGYQTGMLEVTLDLTRTAFEDLIAQVWDVTDDDWMANYFKLNGYEFRRLPTGEPT